VPCSKEKKAQLIFLQANSIFSPKDQQPKPNKMCHTTHPTTHACGHARTASVTVACASAFATGRKCSMPRGSPQVVADSKCWKCLEVQIGGSRLSRFFEENLVLPETTVITGKVEEEWMDVYGRERERRARARMDERRQ
jgi:hypothetical protein